MTFANAHMGLIPIQAIFPRLPAHDLPRTDLTQFAIAEERESRSPSMFTRTPEGYRATTVSPALSTHLTVGSIRRLGLTGGSLNIH
jgi:hypothetical protein